MTFERTYQYDIAISYAGEDRSYAESLADAFRLRGLKVFYDHYEKSTLWGKNLYEYLSDLYQHQAHYCVMLLSQYYAAKVWTTHEREAAQNRAVHEKGEYILPIRLDGTEIPGHLQTLVYLDWHAETVDTITTAILEKLRMTPPATPLTVEKKALPPLSSQSSQSVLQIFPNAPPTHLNSPSTPSQQSSDPFALDPPIQQTTMPANAKNYSLQPLSPRSPEPSTVPFEGTSSKMEGVSLFSKHLSRRMVIVGVTGLVVMATGGSIVWLIDTRQIILPLYTYKDYGDGVAWSPDGKHIASGSKDYTVQVWNAADGSSPYTYKGHANYVTAVAWSPDGKHIASGSADHTVQVWNALNGSSPLIYKGHTSTVDAVAWSPDGKHIASVSDDHTAQVWNTLNGSSPFTYTGHTSDVHAVAWSPDGKRIASASKDGTVQVWNAFNGSSPLTYKGHMGSYKDYPGSVDAVAWSPDGKRIASGGTDYTVQVWNAFNGSSPLTYTGHANTVSAVAWSPSGERIASGGADHTVQVWNVLGSSSPLTYKGHTYDVNAVAWSPDGKRIASGSYDGTVQVWST